VIDLTTFHTITFDDPVFKLSMFKVTVRIVSNTTYQVIVAPLKYLFI